MIVSETAEQRRLREDQDAWRRWGPYVSERQWATVREDYSRDGDAWGYLTHDMARSRAYRWGEDGIGGICDSKQRLCFAPAFWNERDPILKERFFGLSGPEGNHGEDVKECYFYLDSTPSHSYMRMLYKYPQREFPYRTLLDESRRRTRLEPEPELFDTGVFDDDRYFDIVIEYAKAAPDDILIRLTVTNRGPETAPIHVVPQLWFRNTWVAGGSAVRPRLNAEGELTVRADHPELGGMLLAAEGTTELLFCENETNTARLFGAATGSPRYPKDGIDDYIVRSADTVNLALQGTKCALRTRFVLEPGAASTVRLRLARAAGAPFEDFDSVFRARIDDADAFYAALQRDLTCPERRSVQRQALAGMLWAKQFYCLDVERWLEGDRGQPAPPPERKHGRNKEWRHLTNDDVFSMPDKWEYPWYAAWDLAFHCLPLAMVDPKFAKRQLILILREWYMHPNGQLPAYEWCFGDVNPPVHAWAVWRVFQIDRKQRGDAGDIRFLERAFHKLLLNFTWWVNRKDLDGRNIFEGGFLGLDNIGLFDRSKPPPFGGRINQSDGTSWMAMYALNLMRIALELALHNSAYEDAASKFFEHFLHIARAMNGGDGTAGLWDASDEFYYDVLSFPNGESVPLRIRSMVGLIPLFAVETLEPELLERVPHFHRRLRWFLEHRPEMADLVSRWAVPGVGQRGLLSLLRGHRMKCLLRRMLDEREFLSPFGVRSLSAAHREQPFVFHCGERDHVVRYEPGESETALFGGNSNWRGPIWFPVNYLIIESLQRFHHYYGDEFLIECPTGSGNMMTINDVACELGERLTRLFLRDENGTRPYAGQYEKLQHDPHFRDHLMFHEYFHGDTGKGLGASHQTGWTGLIARILQPRAPCK